MVLKWKYGEKRSLLTYSFLPSFFCFPVLMFQRIYLDLSENGAHLELKSFWKGEQGLTLHLFFFNSQFLWKLTSWSLWFTCGFGLQMASSGPDQKHNGGLMRSYWLTGLSCSLVTSIWLLAVMRPFLRARGILFMIWSQKYDFCFMFLWDSIIWPS